MDRGQRGGEEVRERDVVEPDEGDLIGAFEARFARGAERPERHEVVRAEDRRRRHAAVDQPSCGAISGFLREGLRDADLRGLDANAAFA